MYVSFRVSFRRIYITNAHLIPKDKPVLITPNHPNSFIDGILLAVLLRRKLNQLARGDTFKTPIGNWALRSLRLLPIFRADDGAGSNQKLKNQESFETCYRIFRKNGSVLIFPEGLCVSERRLRPLKKGAARMAFEFIEKNPGFDLLIVPIGINYSNTGHFREEVCINFAKPFSASEFSQSIVADKTYSKAIVEFNNRLFEEMERELVIIKNPENDTVGNEYLLMARNQYKPSFWGFFKKTKKRFLAEKRAANDLNHLSETNPEGFETFKKSIHDYCKNLKQVKIKDKYFAIPLFEKILYLIFTITFFQVAFIGMILNFIPVVIAKRIADKIVAKIEFYDSVNMCAGALISALYFLILLLILIPIFGWKGVLIVIGIRLCGFLFLFWKEAALNTLYWYRILVTKSGRNINRTLQSQRKFILEYFG